MGLTDKNQHTRLSILQKVMLVLILLAAATLRLMGIDFGLPHIYHPDEDQITDNTYKMMRERTFQPVKWTYPPLLSEIMIVPASTRQPAIVPIRLTANVFCTRVRPKSTSRSSGLSIPSKAFRISSVTL